MKVTIELELTDVHAARLNTALSVLAPKLLPLLAPYLAQIFTSVAAEPTEPPPPPPFCERHLAYFDAAFGCPYCRDVVPEVG